MLALDSQHGGPGIAPITQPSVSQMPCTATYFPSLDTIGSSIHSSASLTMATQPDIAQPQTQAPAVVAGASLLHDKNEHLAATEPQLQSRHRPLAQLAHVKRPAPSSHAAIQQRVAERRIVVSKPRHGQANKMPPPTSPSAHAVPVKRAASQRDDDEHASKGEENTAQPRSPEANARSTAITTPLKHARASPSPSALPTGTPSTPAPVTQLAFTPRMALSPWASTASSVSPRLRDLVNRYMQTLGE